MNLFDQIWSRVVKIGGFALGAWIMYHEAFADSSDRPYLYAAALVMMGLQIAESMDKFIDAISQFIAYTKSSKKKSGEEPRTGNGKNE